MATALKLATNVADIVGIEAPTALKNSVEPQSRAMLRLLNRAGQQLARVENTWNGSWTFLEREHTFTTIAGQRDYDLPADFERIIEDTTWDRDTYRQMRGNLSPQEWQQLRSGLIGTVTQAPYYRIRRAGVGKRRALSLDPIPSGGDVLVYEYVSNHWVVDSAQTASRAEYVDDTDEALFNDDLMEMSLLWRFKQSRGLSFSPELAEYETEMDRILAQDSGARPLRVSSRRTRSWLGYPSLADGNWNVG